MSLLIEALKRAEEAKRQQTEQKSVTFDISQDHVSFEQPIEEPLLNLEQISDETLLLEEPRVAFNFDEKITDINLSVSEETTLAPMKIKEKSNNYDIEWLPLEEIKLEEKPPIKPTLEIPSEKKYQEQQPKIEEVAPKTEKVFNIEETFSKPWTKEEQAAAAAELQAARSSTSLKPLFGYLALLIVMLIILGSGYFFVSQKVEELGKSSFTTNQVQTLPSGGLAATLAEIQKKSQQEQTVTQPQTVITQIATPEEKPVVKSPIVPLKNEQNQLVTNTSQTPIPASSLSQTSPPAQTSKRLKIEHNLETRHVDNRLQEAYQAYQQGSYAKAKKLYVAVLQGDKHSRDALLGLAGIAVQNQQLNQAKTYYQQVLEFYPKDAVAEAGLIDLQGGEMPENENALKNQLNQQPESSHLQFVLGNFYSRQQRWGEAQQAYFEAYRRNNQHPDYAYNLAVSLDNLGKSPAALPYYQRALMLSSTHKANFDSQIVQQRISELEK